jgi:hypothetical protein
LSTTRGSRKRSSRFSTRRAGIFGAQGRGCRVTRFYAFPPRLQFVAHANGSAPELSTTPAQQHSHLNPVQLLLELEKEFRADMGAFERVRVQRSCPLDCCDAASWAQFLVTFAATGKSNAQLEALLQSIKNAVSVVKSVASSATTADTIVITREGAVSYREALHKMRKYARRNYFCSDARSPHTVGFPGCWPASQRTSKGLSRSELLRNPPPCLIPSDSPLALRLPSILRETRPRHRLPRRSKAADRRPVHGLLSVALKSCCASSVCWNTLRPREDCRWTTWVCGASVYCT